MPNHALCTPLRDMTKRMIDVCVVSKVTTYFEIDG